MHGCRCRKQNSSGGGGIQAMPIFALFRPDPIDYKFHGFTSIKIELIGRGKKKY